MRLFLFLLVLCMSVPALAQDSAIDQKTEEKNVIDLQSLGRPIADDSKDMMDRFVYFDADATDIHVALDNPVLSPAEIREWIRTNISSIFTLDGQTYDAQTVVNRRFFTPRGYADYVTALRNSQIDSYLKKNRYRLSALILEEPIITGKGLRTVKEKGQPNKRVHVWQIETRVYLAYLDYANNIPEPLLNRQQPDQSRNTFSIDMKVEIVRTPMQKDGSVIAISMLLFDK